MDINTHAAMRLDGQVARVTNKLIILIPKVLMNITADVCIIMYNYYVNISSLYM